MPDEKLLITFDTMYRYGQLSKHYYAGSERIASRLAGPASAFAESEDLEGDHVEALPAMQRMDIRMPLHGWDIGFDDPSFVNDTLPEDNCSLYPPGSEEHKQCLCDQEADCPSVIYWFHPDHLGSSTFLTDAAGDPYQFVMYLPFGELFTEQRAAGFGTPYLFNAKELDEETGLYYYGARYYDPRVSMWWGVDPLADHPNQVDKSPYAAFWNNPVYYTDSDGKCPDCPEKAMAGDTHEWGGATFKYNGSEWVSDLPEVTVKPGIMNENVGSTSASFGAISTAVSEVNYSKKIGTYLGNGSGGPKLYDITKQSNGATGSKALAKSFSNSARITGNAFTAISVGLTISDLRDDYISNEGNLSAGRYIQFGGDLGISGYGVIGGLPGAALNIGWELGRAFTNTKEYQEWMRNVWLPYRQKKLGY